MDLIPDEDHAKLKKYHNKFTQIAVVQVGCPGCRNWIGFQFETVPNWNWIGIGLDGLPKFWAIPIGIAGILESNLVSIGLQ